MRTEAQGKHSRELMREASHSHQLGHLGLPARGQGHGGDVAVHVWAATAEGGKLVSKSAGTWY